VPQSPSWPSCYVRLARTPGDLPLPTCTRDAAAGRQPETARTLPSEGRRPCPAPYRPCRRRPRARADRPGRGPPPAGQGCAAARHAVSHALTSIGAARQGYDDLAERGERLIARLRGTSFDDVEDRGRGRAEGTPLAKPYDRVEDALEDVGEASPTWRPTPRAPARRPGATRPSRPDFAAAGTVEDARRRRRQNGSAGTTADQAADQGRAAARPRQGKAAPKKAVDPEAPRAGRRRGSAPCEAPSAAEQAAAEAEKAAAAARPEQAERQRKNPRQAAKAGDAQGHPGRTRIDTAAAPDVCRPVSSCAAVGGVVLEHDELPLPDYDHLTLGSLRGRMRSLDLPQLIQIRDYEKAHADRLPIVTMLDNRIAKLANDPTAPLSGSNPAEAQAAPDKPKASRTGSPVNPMTGGPKQNPTSQGDPTNPGQPRGSGSGSTNPNNPNS
jgi:hypothetical protein